MRLTTIALLLALAVTGATAPRPALANALPVFDEAATTIRFENGRTHVSTIVRAETPLTTRVELELLDPNGKIVVGAGRTRSLAAGPNQVVETLSFDAAKLASGARALLPWYRLRYRAAGVDGIVSLSEVTPDLFDLDVLVPEAARGGSRYVVHVRARHPVTGQAAPGVAITARATIAENSSLEATAVTDERGLALVSFDLSKSRDEERDVELDVIGRKGDLEIDVDAESERGERGRVLITTDKGLYQPGQTLHVRAVAFDAARRARAGARLRIVIQELNENEDVFAITAETNRFGVAAVDWRVPEDAPLGTYAIVPEMDEEEDYDSATIVEVSRYELPTFAVQATTDRAYYLPGQNTRVDVRADYLFGKPVTGGRVRVVHETERKWNREERRWDVTEGKAYEGELDASGRFTTEIDLSAAHAEVAEYDWRRYEDLTLAAYVTDASTGRTEQQKFDVRVTREPIHVYAIEDGDQRSGFPTALYITTGYADGTPVSCDVIVRDVPSDTEADAGVRGRELARVRTNALGVARVSVPLPPPRARWQSSDLELEARDAEGRRGTHVESIYPGSEDEPVVRVETARSILRPGDPIDARLVSSEAHATILLTASVGPDMRFVELVPLREGRAEVTIPYEPSFQGVVSIVATLPRAGRQSYGSNGSHDGRAVVYPKKSGLRVEARPARDEYRPGEEASVEISVAGPDGRPVESALGAVVFDRAVEERMRTDARFGGSHFEARFWRLWYGSERVSGYTRADLRQLDLSAPVPEGLDLVAEVLLRDAHDGMELARSGAFAERAEGVFRRSIERQMAPVMKALVANNEATGANPTDAASLRSTLAACEVDLDALRDPWGVPYRAEFGIRGAFDFVGLASAGPDERFGSYDDFEAFGVTLRYFDRQGRAIDEAIRRYHDATGRFVRDEAALREALSAAGLDPMPRDRWGTPYVADFEVDRAVYVVRLRSAGPDRAPGQGWDDFVIWINKTPYFEDTHEKIDGALDALFARERRLPASEREVFDVLAASGIGREALVDPWGSPYFVEIKGETVPTTQVRMRASHGERARQEVVSVERRAELIVFWSAGPDRARGTTDDFVVASHSRLQEDASSHGARSGVHRPGGGAIVGTVTDPQGAVIGGARIEVRHVESATVFRARADDSGRFELRGVPVGYYEVSIDAVGFTQVLVTGVRVRSATAALVEATLYAGGVTEAVTISGADRNFVETTSSSVATTVTAVELSTPRLREYFPETLLWSPMLETDALGRAGLRFRLADSITTWKLSVVASTVDGEVGEGSAEIRAFQPFFAELDPPKVLTVGDEVSPPVVLRSYLDEPQAVDLALAPASWFSALGPSRLRVDVRPGEPARAIFPFRAVAITDDGRQRVTAIGASASDAIEKPVRVRPDGREVKSSSSAVVASSAALGVTVPDTALPGIVRSELRLYPNLLSHVEEGIEAIMSRPYGCAEQAISVAYPSLLVLRMHARGATVDERTLARARRYLEVSYERLVGYQSASGGFAYFAGGDPDVALTAYAVKFLSDARELVAIDARVHESAIEWLATRQGANGRWTDDALTAYVARVLAESSGEPAAKAREAATRALALLDTRPLADNPHALASIALAALAQGDANRAAPVVAQILALAREEKDATFWEPPSRTPFNGWGRAARVETTALVVRALTRAREAGLAVDEGLARRGLLSVLREKDSLGVWYSTQTTVNVYETLVAMTPPGRPRVDGAAEVVVDGRRVGSMPLAGDGGAGGRATLDVSEHVGAGAHSVEIRLPEGAEPATAQLVTSWWVPWGSKDEPRATAADPSLKVEYSSTRTRAGEAVTCRVGVSRPAYSYGMLIAEVGLPPGAEVDRESLERMRQLSGWSVGRYDVLPDRVVLYVWPRLGGVELELEFSVRYGIDAKTAPSQVYDYYNPESLRVLAPVRFVVAGT